MKKYKNNYVRIISILLILCTLCGTASATDISSITATSSPIEVLVDNSTASFVLKNNDSEYYKYALEIMNTDDETYLLCDTFEANETAKLTNIKTDTEYPVWLEVYSETEVLFYDGFFVVDTSNVTSVSLTKVKTKTNTEKTSEEDIESLFEMTDEQYGKLFSSLDIPSFISEEDAKTAKHVKRLEEYEDSYDKIGYKNADGTNTLYIFSSPVKYMDENGELQDADPNISETTGTEKSEGYSFVNDYGELKTYFADSLSNDKGIKIKKNDIEFEFGFTVKEKKENALTKLTSKVKNIFSKPDNKATVFSNNREKKLEYAKVENGIDIVSLPTTNGAVQTLILDDVPENNKLTFWVESNGLTPELDLYNKNVLFSTENDYVFSVGNVEIEDSATEDQIQSGLHFSTDNTVKILNNQNGRSLVEVSLDEDVLTSPTTVYPVSVTLSAAANETNSTESENSSITTLSTTSAPSEIGSSYFQDRTVYTNDSEDPANSPYLIIGDNNYYTGGYYDDSNCTYVAPGYVYRKGHVFMKYDVSSLTNIDPKLVDDAQLVLREGSGNNSELEVDLYRVTKPWTESTVDISYVYECDNQYSGNNDIVFADSGTGIEYEIDVAHMLTDNLLYSQGKDGGVPNYGFHLFTNDLYTSVSKHICSSEHSNIYYRPKVVISYDDPFPLTLGYETAHGDINAADPSDWYSFTPIDTCLYSIFTTSDVDTYGQLFDSSFNLLIADDDSGEENNFNITYNLTAGQTYYIRVRGLNYGDTGFYFIKVVNSDPFHVNNIEYVRYTRITGNGYWFLGGNTDHTIGIIKSSLLENDYFICRDNIDGTYSREYVINSDLINTLNNLESGYQNHYNIIPVFNTTTDEEAAAHSAKGETDQLVDQGYFEINSSEYYGCWAYNYTSTLNLSNYWEGVLDTASAAYGVYVSLTAYYYSHLSSTNMTSINVTSDDYINTSSYLDDIDNMLSDNISSKKIISAEQRNSALANENYTNPPYRINTPVIEFEHTSSTQYIRVFANGTTSPQGKWLMKYNDIVGLTPAQIQAKFALPYTPTHYVTVNVPANTKMCVGMVGPNYGFTDNLGIQFELLQTIDGSLFGSAIPLS